ncbi:MAG: hypothetical protein L0Y80_09310 [Ignavibacteriae bacterium]|nr:hypothetical protein [Ignavibacteriota bacterium]
MANLIKDTQVLYDARGKKSHVVLPYDKYKKLIERLEDAEDIQLMKEVENEVGIPWEEAKKKIRRRKR